MKHTILSLCAMLAAGLVVPPVEAMADVTCSAHFGRAALLDDGWLFSLADDTLARGVAYDADTAWRQLSLPHDWSIEGIPSPTLASCTGYLPGGIGWYRKHFRTSDLPSATTADGQRTHYYVYFEGVYNRSEVYLNGHLLGKRPNGYISFLYDLTPWLDEGGDNVLAVRVDHSRAADSRWYTGSGIYRDVWVIAAPPTHLALWGTTYSTRSLSSSRAVVDVETTVTGASTGHSVRFELVAADGSVAARRTVGIGSGGVARTALSVAGPHAWSLNDPYLYTLRTTLVEGKRTVDVCDVSAGLRTLTFDPNFGFALNRELSRRGASPWLKMKGVCLHHDAGALGAAVPPEVWERRLAALKGIGVNAIRMSHNPQAPVVYDLCDRLGLLVMDEASDEWEFPKRKWVEGWNVGTPSYDGTYDFFEEWIDRDVADMVRRDRTHASVVLWSIGNEVDYPNDPYSHPVLDGASINQPMFGGYDPSRPNAERIGRIAQRLAAVVRRVDTSRPVTGALAGVVMSNETDYPDAVDVVGYNYTEDRYATDHAAYPDRVIYGSETGSSHEAWLAVRDNDHIFGQFIWTGADYLGESGRWPSRGLGTGLLGFGSMPKPRGWHRASVWSEAPVMYVGTVAKAPWEQMARRWGRADRELISLDAPPLWNYDDGIVRVFCYTNAASARLLLDGEEVGALKPYDDATGVIWWDVPYRAGTLTAIGYDAAVGGRETVRATLATVGRPARLRATLQPVPSQVAGDGSLRLSGVGATLHVLVEVLDDDGHVVHMADNDITCTVEGPARLLGLENSDNQDMTIHKTVSSSRRREFARPQHLRAHGGSLLAYVQTTATTGDIRLRFSTPLLAAADLTVTLP